MFVIEYLRYVGSLYKLKNPPKASTNMRMLSGGMKRRALIAQALVHSPPVIVLDEPTAGVDVELRQKLWDFIKELNKEGKHDCFDHSLS